MNRVFTMLGSDGYQLCYPIDDDEFIRLPGCLTGRIHGAAWEPLSVVLVTEVDGAKALPSDSPWWGSYAPIFNRRAVDGLGALLTNHGELLRLDTKDEALWMFNATRVVDALDPASDVGRLPNGDVFMVHQYLFDESRLRGLEVFKLAGLRVSPVFVGQNFVDTWHRAGLCGLDFPRVWTLGDQPKAPTVMN